MKARQRSDEAESDPLNLLAFYQRGVIPKYLKECFEALQKRLTWLVHMEMLSSKAQTGRRLSQCSMKVMQAWFIS
jgi:hypothetical protein